MLPKVVMELLYFVTEEGQQPFEDWFIDLDATASARVTVALQRLRQGNFSSLKTVGEGVLECRVDFGPGYRIYLGRDGDALIILLTGGTRKRQQRDIDAAKTLWASYKRRKRATRAGGSVWH